jgi:hypothetical protein
MSERNTLRHRFVNDFLVIVHASIPAGATDWSAMMAEIEARREPVAGLLVIAPPKASINAGQRSDIQNFMRKSKGCAAVLTTSKMARGAVTALSWFGIKIRSFDPQKLSDAVAYLGCAPDVGGNLGTAVRELELELSAFPLEAASR